VATCTREHNHPSKAEADLCSVMWNLQEKPEPLPPWLDAPDDDDPLEDAYGYSRSDLLFGGNW
jgi:hypothetical protein